MFPDKDIELFFNPLYVRPETFKLSFPLEVLPNISDLQLWAQCYFRFLPILEIVGGGKPVVSIFF